MKFPVPVFHSFGLVSLLAASSFFGACSSGLGGDGDAGDGDGDGGGDYLFCSPADTCPPSIEGVDMDTPVSFATDIYAGYFRDSCGGGSGCHGRQSNAAANLFMGNAAEPLDAEQIAQLALQLTQANAEIAPGERLVVPGDWQNSWLMAKLDGCQSSYDIECDAENDELMLSACQTPCGDGMPASEGDKNNPNPFPTTAEERVKVHKVRAWIAQGALSN